MRQPMVDCSVRALPYGVFLLADASVGAYHWVCIIRSVLSVDPTAQPCAAETFDPCLLHFGSDSDLPRRELLFSAASCFSIRLLWR